MLLSNNPVQNVFYIVFKAQGVLVLALLRAYRRLDTPHTSYAAHSSAASPSQQAQHAAENANLTHSFSIVLAIGSRCDLEEGGPCNRLAAGLECACMIKPLKARVCATD